MTRHRQYPTANWALPEEEIDQLERVQSKFAPSDPASRYEDLFATSPKLPQPRKESWREQDEAIQEAQTRAAKKVLDAGGLDAILEFAQKVEAPQWLGRTVAKLDFTWSQETKLLEAGLTTDNDAVRTLTFNFISVIARSEGGSEWVDERLAEAHQQAWSPKMLVTFFCGLPPGSETWERLQEECEEVGDSYWRC